MNDTILKIHETAYRLAAEGQWPTVNSVRERLGSGSNTTINQELKIWRQQFLAKISTASRRPDWPPVLIEAVEKLWQHACELAEQHLESTRQEILLIQTQMQQRVYDAEQQLNNQIEYSENLQQKITQLETENKKINEQNQNLKNEILTLNTTLTTLKQTHQRLEHTHQKQVAEFTAQLNAQQQQYERQAELWQTQLQERETLAYERLEGVRIHLYQQAEAEQQRFKKETDELKQKLKSARAQIEHQQNLVQQQQQHWHTERIRLENKLEQKIAENYNFQQEIARLKQENLQTMQKWQDFTQLTEELKQWRQTLEHSQSPASESPDEHSDTK